MKTSNTQNWLKIGAGEGVRTLDFHLGNPAPYILLEFILYYLLLIFSWLSINHHFLNYTEVHGQWGNRGAMKSMSEGRGLPFASILNFEHNFRKAV